MFWLMYTRCIHENDLFFFIGVDTNNAVTRCLCLIGYNDNLVAYQGINHGRLAYIWSPYNGYEAGFKMFCFIHYMVDPLVHTLN